jgi:N-acetylglucosaminyl-diphospho-decaprenol L-rhamnosyltransferase
MKKLVSVILVTYNSKQIIPQSLKNLAHEDLEIIVVDNASNDGTSEFLKENFPGIILIENNKNQGYGRACNQGINKSSAEYIFILNPDVETNFSDIFLLIKNFETLENPGCLAPDTEINSENKNSEKNNKKIIEKNWVSGAAMLFKKDIFDEIGLFDENIFLYYEETDLLKRIKNNNYKIYLSEQIKMPHLVGKSSAFNEKIEYLKYWHSAWSKFYFIKKHTPQKIIIKLFFGFLKNSLKYLIYLFSNNKQKKIKYSARLSGVLAFIFAQNAFDKNGNPKGFKTK